MNPDTNNILIINGGSSSIKFSLYKTEDSPELLLKGKIENIGSENAKFNITISGKEENSSIHVSEYSDAISYLIHWFEKQEYSKKLKAIGHRIVHGMQHTTPTLITSELLEELKKISVYAPEHLPGEIKLIDMFQKQYPDLPQIACFDTSFHTSMPVVARILPLPRRYYKAGIQRYGFHGLSYASILSQLDRISPEEAQGKIIVAHLGNGASLAAIKNGKSMDTSMGFTPASGIPMSTRTGDLDPGVAWHLIKNEKLSIKEFSELINHESGLLGVSERSSDMRELLEAQDIDTQAAEAVALFCYQAKKWIGSFAAVLGGLDTLVFSGGIGENSPEIRARICAGLQFIGIDITHASNFRNDSLISSETGKVKVRVIKTEEEKIIAETVLKILKEHSVEK